MIFAKTENLLGTGYELRDPRLLQEVGDFTILRELLYKDFYAKTIYWELYPGKLPS
ncbi:hypothetical protein [Nostoc sp. 106C]|uniref:hypothetical protein n=1 Tax=Nostoc sp. 106C TaxID=1932667 RepID=UPI001413106C|nr:hypothetical protein [Nostoc sp. 106C]